MAQHAQADQTAGMSATPAIRRDPMESPTARSIRGFEALSELLRSRRQESGLSQMELAFRLGISQRHLCFVEIARARPSRDLLMAWMDALEAPVSVRNAALHHAGLSAVGARDACASSGEEMLREALEGLVAAHEPYPAVVFDADWRVQQLSAGGMDLCSQITTGFDLCAEIHAQGLDMIEAVASPDGLLSRAQDPEVAAAALLAQFEAESWARPSLRDRVQACRAALMRRFGDRLPKGRDPGAPHLQLAFDTDAGPLTFFIIQTVVGLPQNVTPDALRAELWFPADEPTRQTLWRWQTCPPGSRAAERPEPCDPIVSLR